MGFFTQTCPTHRGVFNLLLAVAATAVTLAIFHKLTEEKSGDIKRLIKFKQIWNGKEPTPLHDSLKKLIAAKVALQMGITPVDALKVINEITGLDVKQLEGMYEELRKEIEELKKRMEEIEKMGGVFRNPEDLNIVFEGEKVFIKPVKTINNKYPFINL